MNEERRASTAPFILSVLSVSSASLKDLSKSIAQQKLGCSSGRFLSTFILHRNILCPITSRTMDAGEEAESGSCPGDQQLRFAVGELRLIFLDGPIEALPEGRTFDFDALKGIYCAKFTFFYFLSFSICISKNGPSV